MSDFENRNKELKLPSYDPPSGAVSQKDKSLPKAPAQAGGGLPNRARALSVPRAREQPEFVFERAPTSSKLLSAVDVNAPLYDYYARQQNIPFEIPVYGGQADIWDSIPMYQSNLEGGVSSGNPALSNIRSKPWSPVGALSSNLEMSIRIGQQQKAIAQQENALFFAGSKAQPKSQGGKVAAPRKK